MLTDNSHKVNFVGLRLSVFTDLKIKELRSQELAKMSYKRTLARDNRLVRRPQPDE
jgi:hypothetical protein